MVDEDTRSLRRALLAHIDIFWQLNEKALLEPTDPLLVSRLPGLRVARMAPSGPGEPWVFLSLGAWELTRDGGRGWEFMWLAESPDPAGAEVVARAVRRHLFDPTDVGAIITLDPSVPGIDALLVCPPYPFNPSLEWLDVGDMVIRCVWLLPITHPEATFARTNGVEALEQRLQEAQAPFLTLGRPSVV